MLVFFTSFFNYFSCILLFFLSQFSHFTFTQNHFFILSLSHLIFFIFSFSLFLFFFTTPQKSSPTQRKIAHAKTKIQLSVLVSHSRSQGIQETPDIPLKERKRQGDFCCFSSGTVTLFLAGSHYFSLHLLSFSIGSSVSLTPSWFFFIRCLENQGKSWMRRWGFLCFRVDWWWWWTTLLLFWLFVFRFLLFELESWFKERQKNQEGSKKSAHPTRKKL